jgi:hypothetical protein
MSLVSIRRAKNAIKVEKYLDVVTPDLKLYRLNQKMPVNWVKNKHLKELFLITSIVRYSYRMEKHTPTVVWMGY